MKTGSILKSEGQQLALFNAGESWADQTIEKLRAFCKARKAMGMNIFRFEEFVSVLKERGWKQPPSPNAYGALPMIAVRAGIIEFTGQYENAKSPKTRSHPVKKWLAL